MYLCTTDQNNGSITVQWIKRLWLWFGSWFQAASLARQVNPKITLKWKLEFCSNILPYPRETCDFCLKCRKLERTLLPLLQQKQPQMPDNQQIQNFLEPIRDVKFQSKQLTWNVRRKAASKKEKDGSACMPQGESACCQRRQ